MPSNTDRKPGRPKGASTKANTVGKKRARRFFDLTIDDGMRSTAAAKKVADEFETTVSDVFKSAKRHEPALAQETMAEAIEIERQTAEVRAVLDMGPPKPPGLIRCLSIFWEALRGNLK